MLGEKINLTYCLRSSNQTLEDEFLPSVIQEIFTERSLCVGPKIRRGGAWPHRISRTAREMFTQIDKDPTA